MARQIKFRIWDGQKFFYTSGTPYLDNAYNSLAFKIENETIWGDEKQAIIQQWTGLLDVKGKDIYEGDIVEFYSGYPNQNDNSFYKSKSAVEFQNGAFWPRPIIDHNDEDDWYSYELKDLEVVGNICENPLVD